MHYSFLKNMQFYRLIIVFFSLLFFPSFFYVVLSGTSTALGLFSALPVILLFTATKLHFSYRFLIKLSFALSLIFFLLFFHNIFAAGFGNYEINSRTIFSGFFLIYIILSSCFFSIYLIDVNDKDFINAILIIVILSFFFGLNAIFLDQNFLGYENFAKSIFPFAEPSHYAITLGPILFASGFLLSIKFRLIIILFSLILSIVTPSLVMLLFSMLMILFFFRWNLIRFLFIGLFFIIFLLFLFTSEHGLYFVDRLSFSDNSKNLTALVYMQGWEDMLIALRDSNWLGIGFQNLGILSPGYYGDLIYFLAGEYKNRNDGSFLVSKIIAEFGILGVLLMGIYVYVFIGSSLVLIKAVRNDNVNKQSKIFIFSNAIIVAFFIELFARGSGYFTPSFFLALTSFFVLYFTKKNKGKRYCFEQRK